MARVRFYFDVFVDEEDLKENFELESNIDVSEEDIVDRAKTLLGYDIQDRDIDIDDLEYEIIE